MPAAVYCVWKCNYERTNRNVLKWLAKTSCHINLYLKLRMFVPSSLKVLFGHARFCSDSDYTNHTTSNYNFKTTWLLFGKVLRLPQKTTLTHWGMTSGSKTLAADPLSSVGSKVRSRASLSSTSYRCLTEMRSGQSEVNNFICQVLNINIKPIGSYCLAFSP